MITKSFETLGLLALVAVVVMVSGKFINVHSEQVENVIIAPDPRFTSIRKATLTVLIVAVSFLALLGVLAIWDIVTDKDILFKSISSLAILAFSAFIIVITCLDREDSPTLKKTGGSWVGLLIFILVVMYLILVFSGSFWR